MPQTHTHTDTHTQTKTHTLTHRHKHTYDRYKSYIHVKKVGRKSRRNFLWVAKKSYGPLDGKESVHSFVSKPFLLVSTQNLYFHLNSGMESF